MLKHLSQLVLFSIFAALAPLSSLAGEFSRPLRANLYDDYDNLMSRGFGRRGIERLNSKAVQEIKSLQFESNASVGLPSAKQAANALCRQPQQVRADRFDGIRLATRQRE